MVVIVLPVIPQLLEPLSEQAFVNPTCCGLTSGSCPEAAEKRSSFLAEHRDPQPFRDISAQTFDEFLPQRFV